LNKKLRLELAHLKSPQYLEGLPEPWGSGRCAEQIVFCHEVNEKKWIRIRIYIVAGFFLWRVSTILVRAISFRSSRGQTGAPWLAGYGASSSCRPSGNDLRQEGHELAVSVEWSPSMRILTMSRKGTGCKASLQDPGHENERPAQLLKSPRPLLDRSKVAPEQSGK